MDTIEKYQNILIKFLDQFRDRRPVNLPNIDRYVFIDKNTNNFQLLDMGWQDQQYIFTVVFHFRILNGKIWIQRNITEYEIVDFLMEEGIPKDDIVLGFRHPDIRPFTGFAAA